MFDIDQVLMTQLDLVARLSRTEDNLLRATIGGSLLLISRSVEKLSIEEA